MAMLEVPGDRPWKTRALWALIGFVAGAAVGVLFFRLLIGPAEISDQAGTEPDPAAEERPALVVGHTPAPEKPAAKPSGEAPPPAVAVRELSPEERDRADVKRLVYDYYAAISANDFEAAKSLWLAPTRQDERNIRLAIEEFGLILVLPETLIVTPINENEAMARFTINAHAGDRYTPYNKALRAARAEGHWKISRTWNP